MRDTSDETAGYQLVEFTSTYSLWTILFYFVLLSVVALRALEINVFKSWHSILVLTVLSVMLDWSTRRWVRSNTQSVLDQWKRDEEVDKTVILPEIVTRESKLKSGYGVWTDGTLIFITRKHIVEIYSILGNQYQLEVTLNSKDIEDYTNIRIHLPYLVIDTYGVEIWKNTHSEFSWEFSGYLSEVFQFPIIPHPGLSSDWQDVLREHGYDSLDWNQRLELTASLDNGEGKLSGELLSPSLHLYAMTSRHMVLFDTGERSVCVYDWQSERMLIEPQNIDFVSYALIHDLQIFCFPEAYYNGPLRVLQIGDGGFEKTTEIGLEFDVTAWIGHDHMLMWSKGMLAVVPLPLQEEINFVDVGRTIRLARIDGKGRIILVEGRKGNTVQFNLYSLRLEPIAETRIEAHSEVRDILFTNDSESIHIDTGNHVICLEYDRFW